MAKRGVTIQAKDRRLIRGLVGHYEKNQQYIDVMLKSLANAIHGSPKLMANIHSTKWRLKDPVHLEDKLSRRMIEAKEKGKLFTITEKNLFWRINDLAGFRILHLHSRQIISDRTSVV